jgi:protein phosphatase PTC2/3
LGDGSEVLTDSDDTEMFDREDKDLDSQVSKASASSDDEKEEAKADNAHVKGESATENAAVKVEGASSGAETTGAAKPADADAPASEAASK